MTVKQTGETIDLDIHLGSFTTQVVTINGNVYQQIRLPKESTLLFQGKPELPTISRSFMIPDETSLSVAILSVTVQEYTDIELAPSKGNLKRDTDPTTVPYTFDTMYTKDAWYPEHIYSLGEPYILRDIRGQALTITPFQYNPVRKTIRFFTDIHLELNPTEASTVNMFPRMSLPLTVNTYFSQLYQHQFLNYDLTGYHPRTEEGSMLIITYDAFWNELTSFAQWKTQRGIPTKVVNVSTIGDDDAIKAYISSYYQAHGLTYVILAGDAAQVPTYLVNGEASDPSYSYIVGNDHDPDIFIGRFSAQTLDQLKTQVNRTYMYEKFPQLEAPWYQKGIGIGSNQGPGDDNEYDWEHIRNIRSQLLNYTYTSIDEFYDGSHGGGDAPADPTDTMVLNALNNGRGIINYCGHGSQESWGTTYFNNYDINQLTNVYKLPFIFSVACYNGMFTVDTCFAEAWMRAEDNGNPTGAIATFMSSISQSWDPPMHAQDTFNNLLVTDVTNCFGELCVAGCIAMNDRYGYQGTAETDKWHVFGDPSLQVRTDIPLPMAVQHDSFLRFDSQSFDVTIQGSPNVICTITYGATLYGAAYTDAMGIADIIISKPLPYGHEVTLTVTGYNKIPYSAQLQLTGVDEPPEKPMVPSGRSKTIRGINTTYTTSTTDPDGHQVMYQFDFSEDGLSEWLGPFDSGQPCSIIHQWENSGQQTVRVRAQDVYSLPSDWSDPLDVKTSRGFFIHLLLTFLEKISPSLYQMLLEFLES